MNKIKGIRLQSVIFILIGITCGTLIGILLTSSPKIGVAFGLVTSIAPHIYLQRKTERERITLQKLWPEILDHIISGLNSGLSLTHTIAALGQRGPVATRPIFDEFAKDIKSGKSYSSSLSNIKERFRDSIADQVFEVLDFARTSGSRDSALTLRTLATYIRSDLALRNEINAKHGWIKNASVLAGLAPWLLLVVLSTQSSTIDAYSNAAGVTILITGVLLTLIAYFWMNRVGRISVPPRIFSKALRV